MKTATKEIPFDLDKLVARVEGFAAGKEAVKERVVKLC